MSLVVIEKYLSWQRSICGVEAASEAVAVEERLAETSAGQTRREQRRGAENERPRRAPQVVEVKAEPVAEPTVEPAVEVKAEPVAEPVVEPAAEVKAEPVAEPVVEPVAEVEAEPVVEPAVEMKAEPVVEPAVESEPESELLTQGVEREEPKTLNN